jgi:acyl-CoA reductase-like NAD-dependent aldehyde dehydrogenase
MTMGVTEQLHPALLSFLKAQPKRMLIDGKWVEAASGKTFETINPATGEVLASVAEADREDIDRAVKAARRAFHGAWAKVKPAERARLLHRLADLIEANGDELAMLEVLDNGMPITHARKGMVPRVAELLRYNAGWATKIHGETIETSVPGEFFTYTLREPVGVVGAIVHWNGPLITATWKLAPALAVGCTVVLKPAEQTPVVAAHLHAILLEAGAPPGTLLAVDRRGPVVATGQGQLRLLTVQPEGKRPMDGAAFARGRRLALGARFG